MACISDLNCFKCGNTYLKISNNTLVGIYCACGYLGKLPMQPKNEVVITVPKDCNFSEKISALFEENKKGMWFTNLLEED